MDHLDGGIDEPEAKIIDVSHLCGARTRDRLRRASRYIETVAGSATSLDDTCMKAAASSRFRYDEPVAPRGACSRSVGVWHGVAEPTYAGPIWALPKPCAG